LSVQLIIEDDDGRRTAVPIASDEITIGRGEECAVRLVEKNVSRRHGRLVRERGAFYIEDLNSLTGILLNGERISGRRQVEEGDLIQISEYDLSLQPTPGDRPEEPRTPATEAPTEEAPRPVPVPRGNAGIFAVIALGALLATAAIYLLATRG
jgi:pSer/pThr/pTyr-binding forkhead associated (FHA) protein